MGVLIERNLVTELKSYKVTKLQRVTMILKQRNLTK